ncbi:MAG TPA: PDZ domain-containing protein [Pyrinomonadaceae bacterium]
MGGYTGNNQYLAPGEAPTAVLPASQKKKRRMSGMSWIFIGLLVFFIGAAAFTALVAPMKERAGIARERVRPEIKSYFGVNEFNQTDEGVIFECVSAPGGPADKAGLVGGDVILSVDGQHIEDDDQMTDLMSRTPVGKTLEIEYLRDGEKKTTKLTTISLEEHRRLVREFERRPEGNGQFGYEDGDVKTIPVPGTKIHGVILGTILRSRPADLAGVKEGDIVVEFDGVPIRHEEEFLMRVRRALPYSTVKVVVMRPQSEPPAEGQMPVFEKLEIPVKMGKQ